jgi:hypothetical protein
VLKTDCHLRNKYRLVLLNGEAILLDINATERKRTAMPGTSDSAYLLLGRSTSTSFSRLTKSRRICFTVDAKKAA